MSLLWVNTSVGSFWLSLHLVTVVKVDSFERLLGPCMDVMKRNIENYEQQLIQLFGSALDLSELRQWRRKAGASMMIIHQPKKKELYISLLLLLLLYVYYYYYYIKGSCNSLCFGVWDKLTCHFKAAHSDIIYCCTSHFCYLQKE